MASKIRAYLLLGVFISVFGSGTLSAFAAERFAWQDTNTYRLPNFEATFPIDREAGVHLDLLFKGRGPAVSGDTNVFDIFRKGLRTATVYHQTLFSWLGGSFIWGKSPQNPQAIELAYHAVGSTNWETRHNAIYFCLSTVRPLTEPILRTFVELGIHTEDPNSISRIAWGAAAQKDRLLFYLEPYLASEDEKIRAHALALKDVFSGKIEAFAWAAERARKKAEEKFSSRLGEIRNSLENGDSASRKETLKLIQHEGIALIMDDSFIPAFAAAMDDDDPKVRDLVTMLAGQRWVWKGTQPLVAIDLMLRASRDENKEVRYNANYYGLSTIHERTDAVIERMLEMAMHDGLHNKDFRGRIAWGLKKDGERVRELLLKWMADFKTSPIKAGFAYGYYLDSFAEKPKIDSEFEGLLKSETPVARALAFGPTAGYKFTGMDLFVRTLRQDLPAPYQGPERWISGDLPLLVVEQNQASTIEKALSTSPIAKKHFDRPLTFQQLVLWGKEGEFESRK